MKLYAKVTDSRGKTDGRGDSEYLEVLFNERNYNRFMVAFDGNRLLVHNYGTGERVILEYAKGEKRKDGYYCDRHAWHCNGEGAYPCPNCN